MKNKLLELREKLELYPYADMAQQQRIEQRRLARRRGRAATIMSSPESRMGQTAVTRLLGGG